MRIGKATDEADILQAFDTTTTTPWMAPGPPPSSVFGQLASTHASCFTVFYTADVTHAIFTIEGVTGSMAPVDARPTMVKLLGHRLNDGPAMPPASTVLKLLTIASRLEGDPSVAHEHTMVRHLAGLALLAQRKYQQAIEVLRQCYVALESDPPALYARGQVGLVTRLIMADVVATSSDTALYQAALADLVDAAGGPNSTLADAMAVLVSGLPWPKAFHTAGCQALVRLMEREAESYPGTAGPLLLACIQLLGQLKSSPDPALRALPDRASATLDMHVIPLLSPAVLGTLLSVAVHTPLFALTASALHSLTAVDVAEALAEDHMAGPLRAALVRATATCNDAGDKDRLYRAVAAAIEAVAKFSPHTVSDFTKDLLPDLLDHAPNLKSKDLILRILGPALVGPSIPPADVLAVLADVSARLQLVPASSGSILGASQVPVAPSVYGPVSPAAAGSTSSARRLEPADENLAAQLGMVGGLSVTGAAAMGELMLHANTLFTTAYQALSSLRERAEGRSGLPDDVRDGAMLHALAITAPSIHAAAAASSSPTPLQFQHLLGALTLLDLGARTSPGTTEDEAVGLWDMLVRVCCKWLPNSTLDEPFHILRMLMTRVAPEDVEALLETLVDPATMRSSVWELTIACARDELPDRSAVLAWLAATCMEGSPTRTLAILKLLDSQPDDEWPEGLWSFFPWALKHDSQSVRAAAVDVLMGQGMLDVVLEDDPVPDVVFRAFTQPDDDGVVVARPIDSGHWELAAQHAVRLLETSTWGVLHAACVEVLKKIPVTLVLRALDKADVKLSATTAAKAIASAALSEEEITESDYQNLLTAAEKCRILAGTPFVTALEDRDNHKLVETAQALLSGIRLSHFSSIRAVTPAFAKSRQSTGPPQILAMQSILTVIDPDLRWREGPIIEEALFRGRTERADRVATDVEGDDDAPLLADELDMADGFNSDIPDDSDSDDSDDDLDEIDDVGGKELPESNSLLLRDIAGRPQPGPQVIPRRPGSAPRTSNLTPVLSPAKTQVSLTDNYISMRRRTADERDARNRLILEQLREEFEEGDDDEEVAGDDADFEDFDAAGIYNDEDDEEDLDDRLDGFASPPFNPPTLEWNDEYASPRPCRTESLGGTESDSDSDVDFRAIVRRIRGR
ncbi:hypothetical protein J8273_0459 [Carpediemonas membranifera]|uniref:ARM repeat-containing protein n=1 Tax=Carpediemonas membranifera TaxID=201153 RepID=A0A8J6B6E9_9EUKA|nr:hypothetical protein J8273_0459 [Carpediemonas membranifera]|eukprot:KAG9395239.1 hypothetical protein J8273_0459 [Carpediemonas membranifera]